MSENSCCSFCAQLPTIVGPNRGTPGKCPLCRQDLWVSTDGVTRRVVERDPNASRHAPRFILAGLGVGLLALVCAGAALSRAAWRPQESGPEQASTPAIVPVLPPMAAASGVSKPVELPPVQVKRAIPDHAARVKPHKAIEPIAKTAVKPIPATFADGAPRAKGIHAPIPAAWKWSSLPPSEEVLQAMLNDIPQLDLDPDYAKKTKGQLAELAAEIVNRNAQGPDAFVKRLVKDRVELSGLPFVMGKDCTLPADRAKTLGVASISTRRALAQADQNRQLASYRSSASQSGKSGATEKQASHFWRVAGNMSEATVPVLHQILSAQDKDFRFQLAQNLKDIKGSRATDTLAKLALYDLNPEVRGQALKELAERPKEEYLDTIAKAFRYPWEPVNRHAFEAASALKLKELIPDLVATFNEPDPTAPFTVKTDDGKEKTMIRELVRINHHRNCMLCHAPLGDTKVTREMAVGPVTSMQDDLPPMSSFAYYGSQQRGSILVRADVTYLRQDFSVVQKVNDPGKWPALQRFDFFVRTREIAGKEHQVAPLQASGRAQAVLAALEGLTGKSGPPQAAAWAQEVRDAPRRQMPASSK